MDAYVKGTIIKKLREAKSITQTELAKKLDVTNKAVSKWETRKRLPDISLIAPLAAALGVSIPELMSGEAITNKNRAGKLYPEGSAECRLTMRGKGALYIYCNKHGLMKRKV